MEKSGFLRDHFKSIHLSARLASSINESKFMEKIKDTFVAKNKDLPYKFHRLKEKFESKVKGKAKEVDKLCSKIKVVTGELSRNEQLEIKKNLIFENLCFSNYEKLLNLMKDLVDYFVMNFQLQNFVYMSGAYSFLEKEINRLICEHNEYVDTASLIGGCSTISDIISNFQFDSFKGD